MRLSTFTLSVFSGLIAAVASNTAIANYSVEPVKQHTFEIALLAGDLNHDLEEQGFDEVNSKHLKLAYHFQFQSGVYLGVGYLIGESGKISPVDDLFGGNELEYNAVSFKAGYQYFSSKTHSLYAEVSLQHQNVSLNVSGVLDTELDEIGWGFASGWRYQLSDNVGFKLGLEKLLFDNNISILSVSGGLSYSF